MLTDEQINYHANGCCTSGECNIGRKALADEIKLLRTQNDKLRGWLDESRSVIEAYQTPLVDDVEFLPSDPANHEVKS